MKLKEKFEYGFCSYHFYCCKNNLNDLLESNSLNIEIWHQDRIKKDILVIYKLIFHFFLNIKFFIYIKKEKLFSQG